MLLLMLLLLLLLLLMLLLMPENHKPISSARWLALIHGGRNDNRRSP
jgi:hypothetical protein